MDWRRNLVVLARVLVAAMEHYHPEGYWVALVGRPVPRPLVVLVAQVDPIDQLLVLVVTTTGPNPHHSHMLLV
jgi:hypothetical protein